MVFSMETHGVFFVPHKKKLRGELPIESPGDFGGCRGHQELAQIMEEPFGDEIAGVRTFLLGDAVDFTWVRTGGSPHES